MFLAHPGTAGAEPPRGWQLRFSVASIDFDTPAGRVEGGNQVSYDVELGGGVGLNAEYRFNRRLGLDLGVLAGGGVDVAARVANVGHSTWWVHDTLSYRPLTAGLAIHLTPDNRVDLSLCPLVALIQYGSLSVQTGVGTASTRVSFDEDFGVGAALGLGVPFGQQRRWSFNANLTYLDSRLDGRSADGTRIDSDYDATIFGLGFGYRF
jgi:opacity protein-like surface antigen